MTSGSESGKSGKAGQRSRLIVALGIATVLALAGVLSLILVPRGDETPSARPVRSAAPRQVSPPGAAPRAPSGQAQLGQRAPAFALPDLQGHMTPLDAYRGRPLVLNVWASWCPPCLAEMPSLERLHQRAGDRFRVVSISVDEDLRDARRLAERLGLSFPVLLDPGGDAAARYGTVMFPETWLIDAEGRVVERVVGERDWDAPGALRGLLGS